MNRLAIFFVLSLFPFYSLQATSKEQVADTSAALTHPSLEAESLAQDPELLEYEPAFNLLGLKGDPSAPDTSKLLTQVIIFLFILGAGAFSILYLSKKGRFNLMLPSRQREGGLKVVESKMLGNKQFLMVVEYGNQKMLLGVGPGMINHLCYLNHDLNENEIPREALTQRQEVL